MKKDGEFDDEVVKKVEEIQVKKDNTQNPPKQEKNEKK